MQKFSTQKLTRAGIVACLYIVLSLVTFSFSGGAIQLRLSESLVILPLFFIESVPALFVGCFITNLITGCVLIDVILGSIVTLFSGFLTYFIGKMIKNRLLKVVVGGLFPIILNAFLLPLIWTLCYKIEYAYLLQAVFLLASQTIVIYGMGIPLFYGVEKLQNRDTVNLR